MKKRILQFIGSFHQGGSERQATALSCALKNEGTHDIYVATLNNDGVLRAGMEAAGFIDIPEFPLTSFFNANFVRQVRACAAYLKENNMDLVHTHDFYTNVFRHERRSLAGVSAKVASNVKQAGCVHRRRNLSKSWLLAAPTIVG
ncbi:MAG: glycosyltransferase [Chloracidobacterium sp.]|nr:glycosyltransferase [Chloracidobacterium sp.]